MKKQYRTVAIFVLILLLSVHMAFGGGQNEGDTKDSEVELTVVGHRVHQAAAEGLLDELIAETNISGINWETFANDEIHSTIMRQAALPTSPSNVVYAFNYYLEPRLLNALEPLDKWQEKNPIEGFPQDFSEGMLDVLTHEGGLRGIPIRGVVEALHINTAILDEKGVSFPNTIEDVIDIAGKLTFTRGDGEKVYGYSFHNLAAQIINLSRAMYPERDDAGIVTMDYRVVVDHEPAVAAIKVLQNMYEEGILHPDAGAHETADLTRMAETGRLAMWIANMTNNTTFNDPERSVDAGHWEVIPVPLTEDYTGDRPGYASAFFWSIAMPKNCENKELAWEMIRHLSSAESQLHSGIHNANQPTRSSVFRSDEYQEAVPYAETAAQLTAVSQAAWPAFETRSEAEQVVNRYVFKAMYGEISAEEAADSAASEIKALLEEAGLLKN